MGLSKYRLGDLIVQEEARNNALVYGSLSVVGLSTQKEMIRTKADLDGVNLATYKIFTPSTFAYVPDTSRRGDKISLAYNNSVETYIVSSISIVFVVQRRDILLPDYLFIYFNRPEFDRYSRFHSWGSARETFSWDEMCDIDIELPPLPIQQKYVDIYRALLANQRAYERGLEDLKLACDATIENLRRKMPCEEIAPYLIESDRRNALDLKVDSVRGLATSKEMIPTKADMNGVSLTNYKIVEPGQIAYVADTSRRGDKVSMGYNNTDETFLVSAISIVFSTVKDKLLPDYLMLFLTRSEFDRYARFHSWGSARETFNFSDMIDVKIPIPDISIQQDIVNLYNAYTKRKKINERLKAQIKDLCPVLIKGSLEEAAAGKEA